jgi:hypothetical protein
MVIAGYFIVDWCLLLVIILMVIGGYCISGYWWLFVIILLMAINNYYIGGYYLLFY